MSSYRYDIRLIKIIQVGLVFIFLTSYLCSYSTTNKNNPLVDSANAAYSKNNYSKAISLYESILNTGYEASELYYNLGNAYYKTNAIGLAILNYERAKKLNPEDEDISTNLKLANQKTEDKIDVAPQLFLTEWKNGIVYLLDEKSWSLLCIIITTMALLSFVVYLSSHKKSLKQFGFLTGTVLFITAIITFFIAQHSYDLTKNNTEAIIISPSITIVGSPDEKGTKLFILHEGTKVNVLQEKDDWMEVKIANGNAGWIKKQNIIVI